VIPLANRDERVPLLTLTQKEDDGEHTFVLHVFIDSRELVRALVRYCREKLKYERFAVSSRMIATDNGSRRYFPKSCRSRAAT